MSGTILKLLVFSLVIGFQKNHANCEELGKAAYVKNGTLAIWNGATNTKKILISGLADDTRPQWSADGKTILYWFSRQGTKGVQEVKVMILSSADGTLLDSWSVDFSGEEGMRLAGVRLVKQVGWYGSSHIFILGNINPINDELRAFGVNKHEEQRGFVGYEFSVCRSAPISYFYQPAEKERGYVLAKDGIPLREQPSELIRLIVPDQYCNAWFGMGNNGKQATLVRISHGKVEKFASLPFADYLHMELWFDNMILFRSSGDIDIVDLNPSRPEDDKRAASKVISQRLERVRDFGPAYDWFH